MMSTINLLFLEDNPDDAELAVFELEMAGLALDWTCVDTQSDFKDSLHPDLDLIIADFNLPDFDALSAFQILQDQRLDIPFIILSGTIGEEKAVEAIKLGVTDYVIKDRIARLPSAVNQAIEQKKLERENKTMLLALQKSEQRVKAIINALPDLVFLIDEDGQYLEVMTGRQEDLLYTPAQAFINKRVTDILPPKQANLVYEGICKTIESGQPQVVEYTLDVPLGKRVFESRIAPAELRSHDRSTVVLIARDITDRKEAQDEISSLMNATSYLFKGENLLEVGEQVVKAVVEELDQADCGLMLVDSSNQKMLRLARAGEYQVSTNETLHLNGDGVVPSAVRAKETIYIPDVSDDDRYIANSLFTRSELVVPLLHNDEIIGVLDLQSPKLDAFSPKDQHVVHIFAERASAAISIRQLIEELNHHKAELEWRVTKRTIALQQSTERIEAILNNSDDVIILTDQNGLIQQVNPAFERQFQFNSDDVFDRPLDIFITPDHSNAFRDVLEALVITQEFQRLDLTALKADKTTFYADVVLSPVMNKTQLDGIICSFRDVTERKYLEDELRKALQTEKELNELKSRFVSMVSHEYRTPLSIILLSANLLSKYNDRMSEEKRTNHLEKIKTQITHMTDLMDDILLMSKADAVGLQFDPQEMDVSAFVGELIAEIGANNEEHIIHFTSDVSCKPMKTDPKLLHKIMNNLLTNAIKYSPDADDIYVDVTCNDKNLTLSVKDSGIGIPEDDQKRLFESFHRANNVGGIQGTGLGLAILKQAVDAHQGTLEFESIVNTGTTFTVHLPIL